MMSMETTRRETAVGATARQISTTIQTTMTTPLLPTSEQPRAGTAIGGIPADTLGEEIAIRVLREAAVINSTTRGGIRGRSVHVDLVSALR